LIIIKTRVEGLWANTPTLHYIKR